MDAYQLSLFHAILIACALLGVLTVVLVIGHMRARRRYYARLREHSLQVINLEEKECTRLAYDLHDGILPQLATIRLQFRKGRRRGDAASLEKAEETLLQTIDELRSIVRNLVPHNLQEKGIEVVLHALFQQYQALYPTRIDFTYAVKTAAPEGFALHLYRLVQEAVYNALVHSGASVIEVAIRQSKSQLYVLCRDNGRGLPAQYKKGFGLRSLSLRTVVLNGQVRVNSQAGKGTTYYFTFPYFNNDGTNPRHDR